MLKILGTDADHDERQGRPMLRPRPALVAASALLLALLAVGLWRGGAAPRYDTVAVRRGVAVLAVYGTGEVEPVRWAKLSTAATARLMKLNVREGDSVVAGAVLAVQDDQVERATLAEFEAKQRFYESDYERKEKLAQRDVVSQQVLAQTRSSAEEFAAKARAQKERIALLSLTSPIDGVVLRRDGELGELLPAGTVVLWVGDPSELQVVAQIDEEDVALAQPGQSVLVKSDAFPGKPIEGRILSITPKGDPVSKTFRVKVAIPPNSGLMVGMTAEVNVVIRETPDALLVPLTSVADSHVHRLADGKPVRTPVVTGIRSATEVEILSGLSAGDLVLRNAASGGKPRG